MGLKEYHQKRNFKTTNEPKGSTALAHHNELEFVVQEHHARQLHYDFRLELNGVLISWAIPKGPPMEPDEKRLAVHVEDHPFEYRHFEGNIPKGSYGAGTVKIWDHGTYAADGATSREESERLIEAGLNKGHISIILHGHILKGGFSLIKMHGDKENQWLLVKKK